ncbi:MAG: hypothetical protein J07HQW2_03056 [Haloquadratum walsbyi J07HQW2]|uniref:Uncharacterized protein n=1 Tax=Haloquadratum walsbyi J07HQW2 TaxID=1238425 RepID=U1PVX7_9EURY|nr:MAG: hypothetical protein J07HQW2_03056 [Haloquadratum walsbyi J07HQW2]
MPAKEPLAMSISFDIWIEYSFLSIFFSPTIGPESTLVSSEDNTHTDGSILVG